jgi:GR25 family glycosyltransferase involved in LPS biosynthesis
LKGSIELALTSKHLRAWENFLESDNDFLWVLEDDAFLKTDSVDRFIAEVFPVIEKCDHAPLFVDIAGGILIQPQEMKIPYLAIKNQLIFNLPITNTTCSYIINRVLCEKLVEEITFKPYLRLIGADWLLNKLFINLNAKGIKMRCIHFDPTILEHGSVTGKFKLLK